MILFTGAVTPDYAANAFNAATFESWTATRSAGVVSDVTTRYVGDGQFVVQYSLDTVGPYTVSLMSQAAVNPFMPGVATGGSPYVVTATPAATDAVVSTVTGTGIVSAVAGAFASFTITAKDQFGNIVNNNDVCMWSLTGPAVLSGEAVNNGDGTYTVQYNATVTGLYVLRVSLNGVSVLNTAAVQMVKVDPTTVSSTESFSYGQGLAGATAGSASVFYVQLRDTYGNILESNATTFTTAFTYVKGGVMYTSISSNVTYQALGLWLVSYVATDSTGYSSSAVLKVAVGVSTGAVGSFDVMVLPAVADAANTVLLSALPVATAGKAESIVFQTKDRFGNIILGNRNQDTITVQIARLAVVSGVALSIAVPPSQITVYYDGNGTYASSYQLFVVGTYSISVKLNTVSIAGSEFSQTVAAAVTKASTSSASEPSVTQAVAGVNEVLTIVTRDAYGNIVDNNDIIAVTLSGPVSFTLNATNQGAGVYTAAFNTTVAGKYVLSAEHSTGLIPIMVSGGTQMQVLVTVAPAPSYFSTTYAQGAGLSDAVANTESTFTVSMLDMFGNPQQLLPWTSVRPDVLVMNITQQNCVVCETYSSVGVPQTGLFVVQGFSYQLTNAAWYEVDVTLGGLSIQNFPRNFSVTAGSSQAPYCKVLWAGQAAPVAVSSDLNSLLAFASADNATALKRWSVAGVLQSFSVNAFDSSGNWQKKYQDFFDARVVSGPEVVNTTLVSQGTAEGNYGVYSSAFTPTVSGVYSVAVTLNGQSLPFAPVSFVWCLPLRWPP